MDTDALTPHTTPDAEQPKKYIRTFGGDIETLKNGGTPNLVPLRETASVPSERPIIASPVPPPQPTARAPIPISSPIPEPEPPLTPFPQASKTTPLKTYESDFSNRMRETHASAATVLAAEQDSAPRTPQESPEKYSRSNLLYGIAGGILLIAGGVGAYVAYEKYLSISAPVILSPTVRAPIFVDEREQVSGTGLVLLQAIERSVNEPLSPGTARLVHLDNAIAADTSVFSALLIPAPDILLRNIVAASSMAGIVSAGGNQSMFFILSVTSFGDTFSGMLAWEPVMLRDLVKLFPPYPTPAPTPATTTPAPAPALAFRDEIIANHDVRIYRDAAGRSILVYGYWNQTTLVIARDAAAFVEIVGRLATSRAQL